MERRRDFLKLGAGALTVLTSRAKGANDRLACAVIGIGKMGSANLGFALRQPNVEVAAVCDVYQPRLDEAVQFAKQYNATPKPVRDFREILENPSIDFVCISTPDHWHAYLTVEACKHGKDVYVEKPLCTYVNEGFKMVEAARKHNRVVQVGTQQRSGDAFLKAVEIVRSGQLGKIHLVRTWINTLEKPEGIGNPPDTDPPKDLDWDLWLGPAPKRPFNPNRWGVHPELGNRSPFPYFRYFWDYSGGWMTDWGIHLIDPIHQAMDEPWPLSVSATGGKFWFDDNSETPDTLSVSYEYPGKMVVTFERLSSTSNTPYPDGPGTLFCGSNGQLYVSRRIVKLIPERGSKLEPLEIKPASYMNMNHWANFMECIKSRKQPASDVERCFKSTAACLLGNVSYRSKLRIDWDARRKTVVQDRARPLLAYNYRKPWKLEV